MVNFFEGSFDIEKHYYEGWLLQMSNPYSVRIFMPDGEPGGLRIIDQPNWSGVGVIFPRANFKDARLRPEIERTGVYLLVGTDPAGGLSTIYIGQGDQVKKRLESHHRDKDFWEWAVFFVSKDNALHVAAAQHIESGLIARARSLKRCVLDNGNQPTGPNLSEADIAESEAFLSNILKVLPLIGISEFEERPISVSHIQQELILPAKGLNARGFQKSGGFVVRSGALAVKSEVASIHQYMTKLREDLVEQGVVVEDGDYYRFEQDYDFGSPSTAAGVLLGRTANGRIEWKTAEGKTLKQIQEDETDGALLEE